MGDAPDEVDEPKVKELDEDDISLLKTYGLGPYASRIDQVSKDIKDITKRVDDVCGIKESDTGLAAPSRWDLVSDKQAQQEEQPLQVTVPASRSVDTCMACVTRAVETWCVQVARCTKIINAGTDTAKYVINIKQIAKVGMLDGSRLRCSAQCQLTPRRAVCGGAGRQGRGPPTSRRACGSGEGPV